MNNPMDKKNVDSLLADLIADLSVQNISLYSEWFHPIDILPATISALQSIDIGPDFYAILARDVSGRNYSVKSLRLSTPPNDLQRKFQDETTTIGFAFLKSL